MRIKIAARYLGLSFAIATLVTAAVPSIAHKANVDPVTSELPSTSSRADSPSFAARRPDAHVRRYDPGADARTFVALINKARRQKGLAPLSIRRDLTFIALRWSARMAAREKIWHNHHLRYETSGWRLLGENVGRTNGSVHDLHEAFLASPKHRKNILDPRFTSIGVGESVSADGRIFVAEEFGWFSRP